MERAKIPESLQESSSMDGGNTAVLARSAGRILVDQLQLHGVDCIFCVPGESYLAVLDALHDSDIRVIVCRQEGGAAMMAEAYGKLTGRPAACFVTRGPGATNAAPGIHIANHDSTPMLMFVGQVPGDVRGRGALQEIDCGVVFGGLAKWVTEISSANRIPEIVSAAIHRATAGRPGPIVISLPEDMLGQSASVQDAAPWTEIGPEPGAAQLQALQGMLEAASRPHIVLGGSRWTADATARVGAFARRHGISVSVSLRRQMLFPTDHPCFVGDLGFTAHPALVSHIKSADLVMLIGGRLGEVPSQGYTLVDLPEPRIQLVHVYPDSDEFGKVYRPRLAITSTPFAFAEALADLPLHTSPTWVEFTRPVREAYVAWSDTAPISSPGRLQMAQVMDYLNRTLPADAILCNGAGNYAAWLHRFYRFRQFGTQLAPTSGSMGYGVPAAVAAKLMYPERTVVAFAGDGCFLMNGQEFATAVQYEAPVVVVIVDNGMLGTVRMFQEREYPGRKIASDLVNPDFSAYAKAFGGHGERVEQAEQFPGAFERALASGKPSIIHCILDPEAITPTLTLSELGKSKHV